MKSTTINFKGFLQVSHQIFCIMDTQGHIQYLNSNWFRIVGHTVEESLGKHYSLFYPSDHHVSLKKAFATVLSQNVLENFIVRLHHKESQKPIWIIWNVQYIPEEDHVCAIGLDITDLQSVVANLAVPEKKPNAGSEEIQEALI